MFFSLTQAMNSLRRKMRGKYQRKMTLYFLKRKLTAIPEHEVVSDWISSDDTAKAFAKRNCKIKSAGEVNPVLKLQEEEAKIQQKDLLKTGKSIILHYLEEQLYHNNAMHHCTEIKVSLRPTLLRLCLSYKRHHRNFFASEI